MKPVPYQWPAGKRSAFLFSVDVDVESPLAWRLRGSQPWAWANSSNAVSGASGIGAAP